MWLRLFFFMVIPKTNVFFCILNVDYKEICKCTMLSVLDVPFFVRQ